MGTDPGNASVDGSGNPTNRVPDDSAGPGVGVSEDEGENGGRDAEGVNFRYLILGSGRSMWGGGGGKKERWVAIPLKHPEDTYSFTYHAEFPGPLKIEIVSSDARPTCNIVPCAQPADNPINVSKTEQPEAPVPHPLVTINQIRKRAKELVKGIDDSPTESDSDTDFPTPKIAAVSTSNKENKPTKYPVKTLKYEKPIAVRSTK
ncbi:hypothetical protein L210DRAFT_3510825 [Boletus edulis BED1]|uniref:Uncharacterized protein n=1 Tax=Boletus edulis BED1 TaxID=1328754 RepID=A0AAD4G660_BOLED|nr:hypothetical protein L210DRAFT_3510825 [Boletus edulis BED1]